MSSEHEYQLFFWTFLDVSGSFCPTHAHGTQLLRHHAALSLGAVIGQNRRGGGKFPERARRKLEQYKHRARSRDGRGTSQTADRREERLTCGDLQTTEKTEPGP